MNIPPSQPPFGPMPGSSVPASLQRTNVPKVFGILSIIFSGLVLLFSLPTACMGLASPFLKEAEKFMPKDQEYSQLAPQVLEAMGEVYQAMGFQSLVLILMSAWLLAIGIGQVRYRRWAAKASVIWGVVGLVAVVGMMLLALFFIGPAYERIFQAISQAEGEFKELGELMPMIGSALGGWTGLFTAIFYAPYPILNIIMFRKQNVREAMIH